MNTKKKLLALLLTMMLVFVSILAVGCVGPDDPPSDKTEWPEAGVYYYDSGNDEYTLTLNVGDTFALIVKGQSSSGSYTLDSDGNLTLDFSAEDKADATATLENDVITLTYEGATMRFLKKLLYTVSFNTNDGSTIADVTVVNGKTLAKPADPTREGYIFVGWYTDSQFTTPFAFGTQPITATTTLYAQWSVDSGEAVHTVTLDPNYDGAAALEPLTTKGGKVYDLPTLTREGYEFRGWWFSTGNDGTKLSHQYEATMVLTEDTTLYAFWQEKAVGSKLTAPVVSVKATSISWNVVPDARSYNVKVLDAAGVAVIDSDVSATTVNVSFDELDAGVYTVVVTAYATTNEQDNASTTLYYNNKVLAKVTGFEVFNQTLVYGTVENAQKYYVTVDCGNPAHNHTNVDNGNSKVFSFANCVMTTEGIKFTVTATADGFASSTSDVFVYKMVLSAVEDLAYSEETQTVSWKPVADAAYYMVSITCGNASHNHNGFVNYGTLTTVDLRECTPVSGKITVKVYPVTKGYASPEASEIACEKTTLATPSGIVIDGTTVAWVADASATEYEVKVGDQVYKTSTNAFDMADIIDYDLGAEYTVSVRAIGDSSSMWSTPVTARYYELSDKLSYSNSTLTWVPVIGAERYEIQVNDGEIISVDGGVNASKVTLNKAGVNLVKVRFIDGYHVSDWKSVEVFAYTVTFDTRGGSNLGVVYKAIGDEITLPTPTKLGYSFAQWYNAPGGPESNAMAYTDSVFAESGAIVLYAYYNPNKIKVEYNYGLGGSAPETEGEVAYERDYQLVVPTPDSVTASFAGWFSAPYGMGIQYTDAHGNSLAPWDSLEGMTLYAFWADPTLSFTLTKVNGKDGYMVSAGDRIALVDEVNIPATYKGLPVLMIAGNGFYNCTNLKTVNLPSSLEQLSVVDPFTGCSRLSAINAYEVEGSPVRYWSQDGVLFYNGATGNSAAGVAMVPPAKTGSFRIPDGIAEINANAFKGSSVSGVIVPASVTKIGNSAFENCSSLTSVIFESAEDEMALTIGERAFAGCTKLVRIVLPARLTEISLTKYSIKSTGVDLSASADAFAGCNALTEINVNAASKTFKSVDGILYSQDGKTLVYCPATKSGEIIVPSGVQTIAPGAFIGCSNVTAVTLPSSLTYVGECAFYGLNTKLESVTFKAPNANSVTIGKYAFRGCTALSELTLESGCGLAAISEGAFYGCTSIEALTIPASITSIGADAFSGCTGLKTLTFPEKGKELAFGAGAFYGCTGLTKVELSANITEMPGIFAGCTNLQEVSVPESSEYFTTEGGVLYNKAKTEIVFFPQGNTGVDGVFTLPSTVKVINRGMFAGVTGLIRIELPTTLEVIGEEAFKGFGMTQSSGGKTELVFVGESFADSLVIGDRAFEKARLASLTLPEHTKRLGDDAFHETTFVDSLVTLNDGLEYIGAYAFNLTQKENNYSNIALNVPGSVKELGFRCFYTMGGSWIVPVLNEGLEIIGERAFENCRGDEITIPSTVTSMGYGAFMSAGFKTVTFAPNSQLKTIAPYAFASASLQVIDIPKSIIEIGSYAFYNCSSLKTITFEEGGTEDLVIGTTPAIQYMTSGNERTFVVVKVERGYAFQGATLLGAIAFPARLTELGPYSFYNMCNGYCWGAVQDLVVTFGGADSRLATIGEYCFYNSHLRSIELPKSLRNLDPVVNDAFGLSYNRLAIGDNAFGRNISINSSWGCSHLGINSITFDLSGTNEITIGNSAFYNVLCETIELPAGLAPYTSYDGTVIAGLANGFDVFKNAANLTTFSIAAGGQHYSTDDGIVYNGDKTELLFCPAGKEGTVTIPATVTKINDKAFYNCTKITAIEFATNDAAADIVIGNEAFYGCTAVESIVLPDTVVSLGSGAFKGCTSLKTLTLSKKLEGFSYDMIDGCNALQTIVTTDGTTVVYSDGGVIYSPDKTTLIYYPASREGTEYKVLDGTKYIAASAFKNNQYLQTVILPAGLIEIGDNAFMGAAALKSIEIPNTVELIGVGAFQLSDVQVVTFEKGGKAPLVMKESAFEQSNIDEIELPARLAAIGNRAFANIAGLKVVTFAAGSELTTIGNEVFITTGIEEITFPDSVVSIGDKIFCNTTGIKRVVFGNGLKTLGASNFESSSLAYVYIPASLETMGVLNFRNCQSLTEVEFAPGSHLTKLPMGTFANDTALTTIVIPASVKELEGVGASDTWGSYGVFYSCAKLESVEFEYGTVCTLIGNEAFRSCTSLKQFEIPSSVAELGFGVFRDSGLVSVTIPATVTKLGHSLLKGCRELTDVVLNTKTTELPANMFESCVALNELTISEYVALIGDNCFKGSGIASFNVADGNSYLSLKDGILYTKDLTTLIACPPMGSVTSVTIPKEVTYISAGAFNGITALKELVFEEGGTEPLVIGSTAFEGCYQITMLKFPKRLTKIGVSAFNACYGLITVELPEDLVTIETSAFGSCSKLIEIYNKSSLQLTAGAWDSSNITSRAKNVYTPTSGESMLTIDENGFVTAMIEVSVYSYETWSYEYFNYKHLIAYLGDESNLVIPDDVQAIYQYALQFAGPFESIVIPAGVNTLGSSALVNCGKPILLFKADAVPSSWSTLNYEASSVICGFDGEEHTYTFTTERGGPIDSITSTYAITLPMLEAQGEYMFAGWYDNPDFTGTPFAGSYYSKDTNAFYARWMTEDELFALYGGTDFLYAWELTLDAPATVTIDEGGERVYYKFTITQAGTYYVYASSDAYMDTEGYLYDGNLSELGYADGKEWINYDYEHLGFKRDLQPGTYYVVVKIYGTGSYNTGTFLLTLSTTAP